MKVLLTGATGYVGKGILPQLTADGHDVVCLIRPGSERKLTAAVEHMGAVSVQTGDLFDQESLEAAVAGCDAIIHLVGIIREKPKKGITFDQVHVTGTRHLVEAAKKAGISRFIQMSALGARANAVSSYHQTKFAAEQIVIESGIPYTIFRPSVIFGPDDEFANMLADLVRLPLTPVIGSGTYRLQPVARQTVAEVFTQALTREAAVNQTFEVGGPEQLTYLQILDTIGRVLGKSKVRKVKVPLPLMKPVINVMEGFSFFPITNTQLTMLLEENICQDGDRLYKAFSASPIRFESGIATYLR
ncbi:complex I NDUFA9 subunit family protein [Brevibacillus humidisoli]|uniref:complex I NDUFA9 subunit family protein n=1 Tax=Brevibacillus humidisoli TaxID=2895522 RepID=UPI001E61F165|nr:complex I NDUFA9 subunit family protein [Brevibacillus humidisoli]UFJ41296.1 complex I NDUFA9 subunit family protein [Brevibacillus humidisoli]